MGERAVALDSDDERRGERADRQQEQAGERPHREPQRPRADKRPDTRNDEKRPQNAERGRAGKQWKRCDLSRHQAAHIVRWNREVYRDRGCACMIAQ